MKPSKYQEAIINWALTGEGNAACRAVAGAGKSSTLKMVGLALVEQGKCSEEEIRLLVFGNQNAKDLAQKFPQSWSNSISTINSCGWRIVRNHLGIVNPRNATINSFKYDTIAKNLDIYPILKKTLEKPKDFRRLVDLARLAKADYSSWVGVAKLCDAHNIELRHGTEDCQILSDILTQVIQIGIKAAQRENSFDFVDQIFLPVYWKNQGETVKFPQYQFVMVDECQDLSPIQLDLVQCLGKRLLFVGDPYQAIMGFAGADSNSYQNIVNATKAKEFPLSICYRCPKDHIAAVKLVTPVSEIESADCSPPTKPSITVIQHKNLASTIQINDVIIARRTAPLVSLCIDLICRDVHAVVKGRDIGEALKEEIKTISTMYGYDWSNFMVNLDNYYRGKRRAYENLDNGEELIEQLNDKVDAIRSIYLAKPFRSEEDMLKYLDSIFADEGNAKVTLYTVHRCKGLENHRVIIIEPHKMPLYWKHQQAWQLAQEKNLLYVALTRATQELIIAEDPEEPTPSWVQSIKQEILSKYSKKLEQLDEALDL